MCQDTTLQKENEAALMNLIFHQLEAANKYKNTPRDQTSVSCIGRRILYDWTTKEVPFKEVVKVKRGH